MINCLFFQLRGHRTKASIYFAEDACATNIRNLSFLYCIIAWIVKDENWFFTHVSVFFAQRSITRKHHQQNPTNMTSKESFVNPSSSSGKNFKSSDGKIQIIFSSKSPKYSVSNTPILIPTKLKRFGLSQVINHLLDLGKKLFRNS